MRQTAHRQLPLVAPIRDHHHVQELRVISQILDSCPRIVEAVHADLVRDLKKPDKGREGLSADQVIRAAILYQSNTWSFVEMAFELAYNQVYRSFCRLSLADYPCKSVLNRDIGRIRPQTWEQIQSSIINYAKRTEVEDGKTVRTDCTVTETTIHAPTDSSLLLDCVRVLTRELMRAKEIVHIFPCNHMKRAKRRAMAILNAKNAAARKAPYADLLKVTRKTLGYSRCAMDLLEQSKSPLASAQCQCLKHSASLTERVIDQTERRVFLDESVPSAEKVVSIFEPHTDVIVKDRRDAMYGHKICLTAGRSGLVTDVVVLQGNPADSTLAVFMMQRHQELFGKAAEQAALDGGFASHDNLVKLKKLGIQDVAFSKSRGLKVTDMVKDCWVYKKLRNFRAGVEGIISFLKRVFGLDRCRWKGRSSFESYVRSAVIAANLLTLARHELD